MANKKRRCRECKKYKVVGDMKIIHNAAFCDLECATKYAYKSKDKGAEIKRKEQKIKDNKRLKELRSRGAWYKRLERVVNQYITKVRDVGKPCCTCGKLSQDVKYDAGHYIAVGSNMDLRFELTNIHIQCSVNCNQFGRGMPVEYDEFIKNKYGSGHYNWLNTKFLCHKPHPTLKEQFPTYQDIECEIKKYADILKSKGITPKLRW